MPDSEQNEDVLPEYNFDYSQAKPNRFARRHSPVTVTLDPDVAKVFTTSEAVNKALRAMLKTSAAAQKHEEPL
jgi:hypothetical protein